MNITIIYQYQQTQKSLSISYETVIEQSKNAAGTAFSFSIGIYQAA